MLSAKPLESGGCGSPGGRVDDWVVTWGKQRPVTFADFNERIMKPHAEAEADKFLQDSPALENALLACWENTIVGMIAQLQAFLDKPSFNEEQSKHLRKAAKQLRKMGWPKTEIDAATWRKLNSTNPE